MTDFSFIQPLWLSALLLPFIWLYFRYRHAGPWPKFMPLARVRYPLLSDQQASTPKSPVAADTHHADILLTLAMCLMVLALAQPVYYKQAIEVSVESEPVDLVIVVGTAVSMALRDYVIDQQRIDRMSLTRRLLDDFIVNYSGRRMGLVILGNPPLLWLPLTQDKMALRDAVARIQTTLAGRLTDMGATLRLVGDNFPGSGATAVIVVTDGGLQVGETSPQAAARQLAEQGFNLYILGMGATAMDAGEKKAAGLIYEPVDLAPLQELASMGNGQLFHVADAGAFNDALATIETIHRKPVAAATTQRLIYAWYWLPLLLALLLVLAAMWRGEREAEPRLSC